MLMDIKALNPLVLAIDGRVSKKVGLIFKSLEIHRPLKGRLS